MRRVVSYLIWICLISAYASGQEIKVDQQNKRAEILVDLPGGLLIVSLDPWSSLVAHTLTLYGINTQSGAKHYLLLEDQAATRAVNQDLFQRLAGNDHYFTSKGTLRVYRPTMEAIVAKNLFRTWPQAQEIRRVGAVPFNEALAGTWEGFYQDYWDSHFDGMLARFRVMSEKVAWRPALAQMQRLTGRTWRGEMYVFAVEGTGKSAMTAGTNICIGELGENSDAGFVHEGLHLLLQEDWAKSPAIQELMARRTFVDPSWKSWIKKYEQAVVVCLDIFIRGLHRLYPGKERQIVENYMDGTRVGDLKEIAWPLVKAYAEKPEGTFEDLMLRIIKEAESRRGSEDRN